MINNLIYNNELKPYLLLHTSCGLFSIYATVSQRHATSLNIILCSLQAHLTPISFSSTEMAKLLMLCTMVAACLALAAADWSPGTSTFYGGVDGSGTMGKHAHIARYKS